MSKFKHALAAVLAALLTSALPAWADDTYTWKTGVEGYFTDVNNWTPKPSTTDTGATFVIESGHVNLDRNLSSGQNVIVRGGELTAPDDLYFGGSASLTLYGGVFTSLSEKLYFDESVSLTLYGGVFTASKLYVYDNASVTLSGGTINLGSSNILPSDTPFRITDGTINVSEKLSLDNAIMSGGTINATGELYLQNFIMSGGTINIGGNFRGFSQIYGGTLGTCGENAGWIASGNFMGLVEDGCTLTFAPESGKTITLDESQSGSGNLILDGAGTLRMGSAQYTGSTTINNGTLELYADDSTLYNLSGGTEDAPVTLNAINATNAGQNLTINTSGEEAKLFVGSITAKEITVNATDDAPFQVYTAANGAVRAESFVVSSGRVDVKGCMEGPSDGEGIDVTVDGGVFSPGNSVGTVEVTGDVAITSNGIALFEFSSFSEGKYDQIIINGGGTFTAEDSTIKLDFESDLSDWAAEGSKYKLVSNGGFTEDYDYSSWLFNYDDLFKLKGGSDGLYLISTKAAPDPNAVPEPSTWALLILGAAGLLYVRKRNN